MVVRSSTLREVLTLSPVPTLLFNNKDVLEHRQKITGMNYFKLDAKTLECLRAQKLN